MVARTVDVPYNKFFTAWSQTYVSGPIQVQMFALDPRQDRQFAYFADDPVQIFAVANPGRLYINGDEPDQYCISPDDYAITYHDFVTGIRAADPTARVSPAGFAQPNEHCCPPDDAACQTRMHSVGYAQQFYDAYLKRFGTAPPANEWRFHDFGIPFAVGDLDSWWARVDQEAAWSVAHGANMVLGSWGLLGWREPAADYQEHLKQAMGRLMNDPRINGAVYWAYHSWAGELHYLTNPDGSLTPEGQTYANPLTDIPASARIVDAEDARARLQWTNTTKAWSAEVEFFVMVPGTSTFAYNKTVKVTSAGSTTTPLADFNNGDVVKGRVRYYNIYGQAGWSPFSDAVVVESSEKKTTSRNGPVYCFLSKRIQSEPCDP
jgi:hypothetical protein